MTGRVITGAGPSDSIAFLDVVVPLWAKASSRSSSPLAGQAENMPPKLHGTFKFPFSIPLPTTAAFEYQKFSLPHSFSEKHTRASVVYELSVHVSRGKMRANNKYVFACFFYLYDTRLTWKQAGHALWIRPLLEATQRITTATYGLRAETRDPRTIAR